MPSQWIDARLCWSSATEATGCLTRNAVIIVERRIAIRMILRLAILFKRSASNRREAATGMVALCKLRELFVRVLRILVPAVPLLSVCWAQNGSESPTTAPPFLSGAEITSQLSYSCPSNTACSFVCPGGVRARGSPEAGALGAAGGAGGLLGADHVTKLRIYLGTVPLGNHKSAPVLFYEFSTRETPSSSGFSISAGLSASSCQVNGLTLDDVGRPPSRRLSLPQMNQ
jgi:hypothetical protein